MCMSNKKVESVIYHYYNCNHHHRLTDDCVVRAISAAMGQSWEKTIRDLTEYSIKTGWMIHTTRNYDAYLSDNGWIRQKQPVYKNGRKMKFKDFCRKFDGHAVANCGENHVTLCADNCVWDIWDTSEQIVGDYWVHKSELHLVKKIMEG